MNYIIVDLEATCWEEKGLKKQNEIIEIGALKLDGAGNTLSEFSAFVKPSLNPELSPFCTKLTSIVQADVDNAQSFPEVIKDFWEWIDLRQPYVLCSWGMYDKNQFKKDCELHQLETDWVNQHISLKHQYTEIKNLKRHTGMSGALWMEQLELDGTHHRGIDDARNIAKIFRKHLGAWKY